MGVLRYNHTGQCVRDLQVARRFYEELMGFECRLELTVEGEPSAKLLRLPEPVAVEVVYLKRDGFVLELLHYLSPAAEPHRRRAMNEPGLTHISLTVDDIDGVCSQVPGYGGRVLEATRVDGAVFITDPDGQLLELLGPDNRLAELMHG